ncbi:MAG: hypothetical protein OHK0052_21930 [Anaerolineales bacterium]
MTLNREPARFVLDSFALLAFLQGEAGMTYVKQVFLQAESGTAQIFLSRINLGEILYLIEREQGQAQARKTLAYIQSLPIQLLEITPAAVLHAAHLKANHRITYANAFAATAAHQQHATLLTGNPEFNSLTDHIRIEWLPREP